MRIVKKIVNRPVSALLGIFCAAGATSAMAELDASVGASSIYLWRGVDQGGGTPSIYGDLLVTGAGFYGSVWATSGGIQGSEEIDLIAGWATELGPLGIDLGVVNYLFPTGTDDSFSDFSEAYLGLSLGGFEVYYFDQVAGRHNRFDDNKYYSLGYNGRHWSLLVGKAANEEPSGQGFDNDYTHVDLGYAYNNNLSFTVSKIISVDDEFNVNSSEGGRRGVDDDYRFVVTYEFPLM